MYDRLLSLILKHRRSYKDFFEIETSEGSFRIPNPLADLNKLEILYIRYFAIYKRIIDEMHFDYPRKEYYGPDQAKDQCLKRYEKGNQWTAEVKLQSKRQKAQEQPEQN
jgi:hypothetical protein